MLCGTQPGCKGEGAAVQLQRAAACPGQAQGQPPHQVQQQEEQGATTMSQQMTLEVLLPPTLSQQGRQDFIHILLFDCSHLRFSESWL